MNKTLKGVMIGFLIGACIMFTTSSFAASVKEFILVKAQYPIFVNDNLYEADALPVLNYQGHTYVPLRATSDLLGTEITWNEQLRQVEITGPMLGNDAFRNILVSGSQGTYRVAGEARVFEATVQYEVEDGHVVYLEGFETASQGGPEWGIFTMDIQIPEESLPEHATLRLILFEESAEDGSRRHELAVPLETFSQE